MRPLSLYERLVKERYCPRLNFGSNRLFLFVNHQLAHMLLAKALCTCLLDGQVLPGKGLAKTKEVRNGSTECPISNLAP